MLLQSEQKSQRKKLLKEIELFPLLQVETYNQTEKKNSKQFQVKIADKNHEVTFL